MFWVFSFFFLLLRHLLSAVIGLGILFGSIQCATVRFASVACWYWCRAVNVICIHYEKTKRKTGHAFSLRAPMISVRWDREV